MRKLQDVLGLPVLDLSSGQKIGVVKDIFFNERGELKGITIDSEGIFSRTSYIEFEYIGSIGDDAVTIGTSDYLTSFPPNYQFIGFSSGKKSYKELPVITTNGHELGHIKDVYFMEEVGKIIGYELSDGFLTDITEGRRTIKLPERMLLGDDALIVPKSEIEDVMFDEN